MIHGLYPNLTDTRESAEVLVRDLERTDRSLRPWGAVFSSIVGFFSLGALPVLLWHDRFREFVADERRQLGRFATWMREHSSQPESIDLRHSSEDLGTRPVLSLMLLVCVVGVIALFGVQLSNVGNDGLIINRVLSWTYHFQPPRHWHPPASAAQKIHLLWILGFSLAYLFHFLQVQAHVSDVRRLVKQANRVLTASALHAVPQPKPLEIGFLWIIAGVFFATRGAWWGIPLALCGAAQQQYMRTESLKIRRVLAARIREIAQLPALKSERTVARRCAHVRCLASLPPGARFCPRCGHDSDGGVTHVPRLPNSV
jgi:hypothetical protein